MSPDPAGLSAASLTLPQSWDQYAYVTNNPLNSVDPTGLDCVYVNNDRSTYTNQGDCLSTNDNGYYVNGTVTNVSLDSNNNLGVAYNPDNPNDPGFTIFADAATSGPSVDTISSTIVSSVTGNWLNLSGAANNGLLSKLKSLVPSVCGGGGFGYGGAGGHAGPVHGEILGLVEYDSRLGGAHGGLAGAGAGHLTGGVESMRTWSDWQAHTTPIGLGGVESPGATGAFGKQINTQSRDIGGLAQYENGNLSLGFYAGTTQGSGRAFGGGAYITLSWSGCHE